MLETSLPEIHDGEPFCGALGKNPGYFHGHFDLYFLKAEALIAVCVCQEFV